MWPIERNVVPPTLARPLGDIVGRGEDLRALLVEEEVIVTENAVRRRANGGSSSSGTARTCPRAGCSAPLKFPSPPRGAGPSASEAARCAARLRSGDRIHRLLPHLMRS